MIRIRFKKKKIYPNLMLGSLWIVIAIIDFASEEIMMTSYIFLIVGCLYVFHFLYNLKYQYLKIENQNIQKNLLYVGWNKKLRLKDINSIEKTYLNYTLKTESDSIKINADLIEDESYKEFKLILKGLNLPEDKRPALL